MTFKKIQEKMDVTFEAIGKLSEELTKSRAVLQKLQEEEKKYIEAVGDSTDAYGVVKGSNVVVLTTFKAAKNTLEDVTKYLEQVKVKILIAKAQIDILERDLKVYKERYSALEDQMQKHDNVVRVTYGKEQRVN